MVPVLFNGTFGLLDLNDTFNVRLIGMDHNMSVETGGNHNAHFNFPYARDGMPLAFCDSLYGTAVPKEGTGFCMNWQNRFHYTGGNTGGYTGSYFYETLLPQAKAILPASWQAVIGSCTKYTDNFGNGSTAASNVTANTNYVFLLAEFEYFGTRTYANTAEQNYQQQYMYYANGNGWEFYRHDKLTNRVLVWDRSPYSGNAMNFCCINSSAKASSTTASSSCGIPLAFSIH